MILYICPFACLQAEVGAVVAAAAMLRLLGVMCGRVKERERK